MSIDTLIINSPYEEPKSYWEYQPETRKFKKVDGRRKAGYLVSSGRKSSPDDHGVFVELETVNKIRVRVKKWRDDGYPGTTSTTKTLIEHWHNLDKASDKRLFFCQIEAIETIIWIHEAPESYKVGIEIDGDGGDFRRYCSKMATGSGKTVVMSLVLTWMILNSIANPRDARFSRNILIVAPGVTVRNRLQVLIPSHENNFYQSFGTAPSSLFERLRQGNVIVTNWHNLSWDSEEQLAKKKTVDKRGPMSDEAYVRGVLGEFQSEKNWIVINDEAHHAWRVPAESKTRGTSKEEIEATVWVGGLDRINRARNIICCHDFSATPFAPSGKKSSEEALFSWIISDFGLNDAIESGLVKTPKVVVRDDGKLSNEYKSRFFHIYNDEDVKSDLSRKAEEWEPLPDLAIAAYYHLGKHWRETAIEWSRSSSAVPPVMITVANNINTAKRIKYAFDNGIIKIPELCDPGRTIQVDSKMLEGVDSQFDSIDLPDEAYDTDMSTMSKSDRERYIRHVVDTVGQIGKPGQFIQNIVSVEMLTEGWDCKTVTHIMGLRAFSSQLLCEQVVGRGLRRTSYDVNEKTGLFEPEYVNIFGVPFSFIPHETAGTSKGGGFVAKTRIEPLYERREFKISWPNIIRIDHNLKSELHIDLKKVEKLEIDAKDTPLLSQLAPMVDGKANLDSISEIKLVELANERRLQRIIFEMALEMLPAIQSELSINMNRDVLLGQLVHIVERSIKSDIISIRPMSYQTNDLKRRLVLTLNMQKIIQHIRHAIRFQNKQKLDLVFDEVQPIMSTEDMLPWWTGRPVLTTKKSQINFVVLDSTWEGVEATELDENPEVTAWAKNDHLGFKVEYLWNGSPRKYIPDFIIRLRSGKNLILEVKGQESEKDRVKRRFLEEWVEAVNEDGRFGQWVCDVSYSPGDIADIIEKHKV